MRGLNVFRDFLQPRYGEKGPTSDVYEDAAIH